MLVCFVIAAVMLHVGTAASGRLSDMRDMDRRYYSISSAADLLRDTLDGQSVTIVRTRTTKTTEVVTIDDSGETPVSSSTTSSAVTVPCASFFDTADGENVSRGADMLSDAAINLLFGLTLNDYTGDDAWDSTVSSVSGIASPWKSILLTPSSSAGSAELENAPVVSADVLLAGNGALIITLSCGEGSDVYSIEMTFSADISETGEQSKAAGIPSVEKITDTEFTKTTVTTLTETKTTDISWSLSGIRKVVG